MTFYSLHCVLQSPAELIAGFTAQMATYGESLGGWFFWALKAPLPWTQASWSFQFGVENGYIQQVDGVWP